MASLYLLNIIFIKKIFFDKLVHHGFQKNLIFFSVQYLLIEKKVN